MKRTSSMTEQDDAICAIDADSDNSLLQNVPNICLAFVRI